MINKLNFELISLDKQELYHKYFSATPTQSADYTFMNIFGLKDIYMLEWAFTDDFVFIRQKYPQTMYWAPIGDWNNKSEILSDYLKDINNIIRIPKDLALYLESNNIKNVEESRDEWEYIYSYTELTTLSGGKFHKKKNLYNQFIKNEYEFKNIDTTIIKDIYEFENNINMLLNNHNNTVETENNASDISNQMRADADIYMTKILLDYWEKINHIIGGIIYIDKKIVAYTIADLSMRDTIVVHTEKADRNYKGSYQAINKIFLDNIKNERFTLINREQDVGDLGLRKAKMSYNPIGFIEKYKTTN